MLSSLFIGYRITKAFLSKQDTSVYTKQRETDNSTKPLKNKKTMSKIFDTEILLKEFDRNYEAFCNPWLKLKDHSYVKSLCKTNIPSWSEVGEENLSVK